MIRADNGKVEIKGTGKDLLVEFITIIHALLNDCYAPPALLKRCLKVAIEDDDIDETDVTRDSIKEILRGENGEEIMQDLVNIMREVVEKDD